MKYAAGFPSAAIRYCLDAAGITLGEVDHIAIPRNPWARLGTKLLYAMRMPSFARERAKVMARFVGIPEALAQAFDVSPEKIRAQVSSRRASPGASGQHLFRLAFRTGRAAFGGRPRRFRQHHVGHRPAAIAWTSTARLRFPHSLGMYYTAVSQYLGFRKFGDEYKVMGLAAYGEPAYLDEFRRIVRTNGGVGFRLGLEYFKHHRTGPEMTWSDAGKTPELGAMYSDYMAERLGPARDPAAPVEKVHRDGAAIAAGAPGRGFVRNAPRAACPDQAEGRLPGRRRGVQLRRQRENFR